MIKIPVRVRQIVVRHADLTSGILAKCNDERTVATLKSAIIIGPTLLLLRISKAHAPDIDGRVYVRVPKGGVPAGRFAKVRVIGHTDYDLIAEAV